MGYGLGSGGNALWHPDRFRGNLLGAIPTAMAMTDAALIEIVPGFWVRPSQVMVVRATRGHTSGALTLKPAVYVSIPGCSEIGWEFDTLDDAKAWAGKIAATVNDPVKAP